AGDGCPGGSISVSVPVGGEPIPLRFSALAAEVPAGTASQRVGCELAWRINVPQGMRVAVPPVALRGSQTIAAGASAQVSITARLAGEVVEAFQRSFTGPLSADFFIPGLVNTPEWSGCGESVILRVGLGVT